MSPVWPQRPWSAGGLAALRAISIVPPPRRGPATTRPAAAACAEPETPLRRGSVSPNGLRLVPRSPPVGAAECGGEQPAGIGAAGDRTRRSGRADRSHPDRRGPVGGLVDPVRTGYLAVVDGLLGGGRDGHGRW